MNSTSPKSWNNDLSGPDVQKEKIYIDTLDKEKTTPCCAKFVTDRLQAFIQALKTCFPESEKHVWDESNENTIKLKSIDDRTSKVLTVTFYKKTGLVLAQGIQELILQWSEIIETIKPNISPEINECTVNTCANTNNLADKQAETLNTEVMNTLKQLQKELYELKETHKAQNTRMTQAYNKIIYDMVDLKKQNQEINQSNIRYINENKALKLEIIELKEGMLKLNKQVDKLEIKYVNQEMNSKLPPVKERNTIMDSNRTEQKEGRITTNQQNSHAQITRKDTEPAGTNQKYEEANNDKTTLNTQTEILKKEILPTNASINNIKGELNENAKQGESPKTCKIKTIISLLQELTETQHENPYEAQKDKIEPPRLTAKNYDSVNNVESHVETQNDKLEPTRQNAKNKDFGNNKNNSDNNIKKICINYVNNECPRGNTCTMDHPIPHSVRSNITPKSYICHKFNSEEGCQQTKCPFIHQYKINKPCQFYYSAESECRFGKYCRKIHSLKRYREASYKPVVITKPQEQHQQTNNYITHQDAEVYNRRINNLEQILLTRHIDSNNALGCSKIIQQNIPWKPMNQTAQITDQQGMHNIPHSNENRIPTNTNTVSATQAATNNIQLQYQEATPQIHHFDNTQNTLTTIYNPSITSPTNKTAPLLYYQIQNPYRTNPTSYQ
jgi:hypothetical protein